MKRCKTHLVRVCLFLLAAVPAYCQRGTIGIDVGQTSDKFGALAPVTGLEFDIDGQVTVIKANQKEGGPSIVAGGEVRIPSDVSFNHAKEYALFVGPSFQVHDLSIGVNAQLRKIYLPTANVDNQLLNRDTMKLFQLPVVIKYAFGPGKRAFVQAQGEPEFSPHFHRSSAFGVALPNPNLDHGYTLRGSAGYTTGKWYVKGTYETRYFKFAENVGNPSNLYNWRSNLITGGVGFVF
jgi:hypothetical protein